MFVEFVIAASKLCSTAIIVKLFSTFNFFKKEYISVCDDTSTPVEGSSKIKISGFPIKLLAIKSFWYCPSEISLKQVLFF